MSQAGENESYGSSDLFSVSWWHLEQPGYLETCSGIPFFYDVYQYRVLLYTYLPTAASIIMW